MNKGVIYYLASNETGRVYVGSTTRRPRQRCLEHMHYLRKGTHHSKHLQRVYTKYGEADLRFIVMQECTGDRPILDIEQEHIDAFKGWSLNGAPVSDSIYAAHAANRGRVMSTDEKMRRSIAASLSIKEGRTTRGPWTEERKQAHSTRLTGRTMPEVTAETKINISAALRYRNALLGKTPEPSIKSNTRAYIQAELPSWLEMRQKGKSFRQIAELTGRARNVISRECGRAAL